MVSENKPSDVKRMAVGMPTGQGAPFYDPFYRVNINRSGFEDSHLRYYDDFSVFNYLHLPKPQSLSINSPRATLDASQNKPGVSRSGSPETVCDCGPKMSASPRNAVEPKYENEPDGGKENHRAVENTSVNVS